MAFIGAASEFTQADKRGKREAEEHYNTPEIHFPVSPEFQRGF